MALGRLSGLNPTVLDWVRFTLDWADHFGVPVTVTSGYRSMQEQAQLRHRWEAGRSQFPANRPGDSAHNFGLAWDATVPGPWIEFWTLLREAIGWSVPANDWPHAEVPGWRELVR